MSWIDDALPQQPDEASAPVAQLKQALEGSLVPPVAVWDLANRSM